MKASDYLTRYLYSRGVRTIFELPGGTTAHILESLRDFQKIRIVSVHHEQAAAFAADATGRLLGIPGVAMATSGPGAINLLTGIASCHFDSSPAVFLTGQVNRHELKGARAIRQLGFQETDIVAMAQPITKAAWQVTRPESLPKLLADAFDLAVSGRPGPVLVDIPMDIQNAWLELEDSGPPVDVPAHSTPSQPVGDATWQVIEQALACAQRPLILAGGGVRASGALEEFRALIQTLSIPVVHSLMAVDCLAYRDPLRVGMIGSYGNRWANLAIGQSDLLVVLGSRLDIRQTGTDTQFFKSGRTIIHVDIESGEMNNRVAGCIAIASALKPFLAESSIRLRPIEGSRWGAWRKDIASLRAQWDDRLELTAAFGINPNVFMHRLSAVSAQAAAYISDVGQHQMWAAQSLELTASQRWLTSGGMGSMGFALPAAIGAATALAPQPVVLIAGDGGFQCNIQELQTVARERLPIKMVVLNNRAHGMVRQFQQTYFQQHYQSTVDGYGAPSFVRVEEAYGIPACAVCDDSAIDAGLTFLWKHPESPALLEVAIDTFTNVYPKIAFGRPITEMEPQSTPIAMTMSTDES